MAGCKTIERPRLWRNLIMLGFDSQIDGKELRN